MEASFRTVRLTRGDNTVRISLDDLEVMERSTMGHHLRVLLILVSMLYGYTALLHVYMVCQSLNNTDTERSHNYTALYKCGLSSPAYICGYCT